jgi:hypothetical protein
LTRTHAHSLLRTRTLCFQAAFIASGGLPLLHDLLVKPNISPAVLLAAVHVYEILVRQW